MFSGIASDTSKSEEARGRLESTLQLAWNTIDQEVFDKLGSIIGHRIEACIVVDSWHTKY